MEYQQCKPELKWSFNSAKPELKWSINSAKPESKWNINSAKPELKWSINSAKPEMKWNINSAKPEIASRLGPFVSIYRVQYGSLGLSSFGFFKYSISCIVYAALSKLGTMTKLEKI